jgi:hypothetical protein
MSGKQVDLFLDSLINAPFKDDRALMEFPFFSLQKAPRKRPLVYDDGKIKIEIRPGDRGIATIWDKDVLIYLASIINDRIERGLPVERCIRFNAYNLLKVTGRGPASGPTSSCWTPSSACARPPSSPPSRRRDQGAARLRLDRDVPHPGKADQGRQAGDGGLRDHAERLDVSRHRQGSPGPDHRFRLFQAVDGPEAPALRAGPEALRPAAPLGDQHAQADRQMRLGPGAPVLQAAAQEGDQRRRSPEYHIAISFDPRTPPDSVDGALDSRRGASNERILVAFWPRGLGGGEGRGEHLPTID